MTIENQTLTWTLDRSHRNEKKITEIKNLDPKGISQEIRRLEQIIEKELNSK